MVKTYNFYLFFFNTIRVWNIIISMDSIMLINYILPVIKDFIVEEQG